MIASSVSDAHWADAATRAPGSRVRARSLCAGTLARATSAARARHWLRGTRWQRGGAGGRRARAHTPARLSAARAGATRSRGLSHVARTRLPHASARASAVRARLVVCDALAQCAGWRRREQLRVWHAACWRACTALTRVAGGWLLGVLERVRRVVHSKLCARAGAVLGGGGARRRRRQRFELTTRSRGVQALRTALDKRRD